MERAELREEAARLLEEYHAAKEAKEAAVLVAKEDLLGKERRLVSLQTELNRMTTEKHDMVMQLKQASNRRLEALRSSCRPPFLSFPRNMGGEGWGAKTRENTLSWLKISSIRSGKVFHGLCSGLRSSASLNSYP